MFFLIENICLNCIKVGRIQDFKNNLYFFFFRKIHKQIGRLEALQLADSTGLGRRGGRRKLSLDDTVDF